MGPLIWTVSYISVGHLSVIEYKTDVIFTKFSSLGVLKIVKMAVFSVDIVENFIKMTTFRFSEFVEGPATLKHTISEALKRGVLISIKLFYTYRTFCHILATRNCILLAMVSEFQL